MNCPETQTGSNGWRGIAPGLLLFARQQASCEADAQDLVQEAVVESWRRQSQGAPPPLGCVYATIRHRAIDLARRDDRRRDARRRRIWTARNSGLIPASRNESATC